MSYIMFQNKGEIPLHGIRLLGLSEKSESQIGRFGSGLKEAVCLLLRLDYKLVIFSGTTRIDFAVRNTGAVDEVCYCINDQWHPMNLHPKFGKHDWKDLWQAFREIACNAIDEGIDDCHFDVASDMSGVEGSTRVYVDADFESLKEYGDLPNKLIMLSDRKPLGEVNGCRVFAKQDHANNVQAFHKGVWIRDVPDAHSVYDYDLPTIHLSESRTADIFDIKWEVADVIHDMPTDMLSTVLSAIRHDETVFEASCINAKRTYLRDNKNWPAAWRSAFGSKAVLCRDQQNYERILKTGHEPVVFKDSLLAEFLDRRGVPTPKSVFGSDFDTGIESFAGTSSAFDDIWTIFDRNGWVTGDKPEVKLFRQLAVTGEQLKGFFRDGTVYINADIIGSRDERLTAIEELAHQQSNNADFTRGFQEWVIDKIERAISKSEVSP
jgi:hypothetical protein